MTRAMIDKATAWDACNASFQKGRKAGMEEAAKWHDEQALFLEQLVAENEGFERTLGIKMHAENESYRNQQATHKKSAAAIRAAMEK